MKRPQILKEDAQITKQNLVGDKYIIAEEDLTDDPIWMMDYDGELLTFIEQQLGVSGITLSSVPREHLKESLNAKEA